ncbi:MAG: hypothetical protein QGG40_18810, partial [Myxococcota bacterium]|nr:hypothetical protein [Myxococcota bacterium]
MLWPVLPSLTVRAIGFYSGESSPHLWGLWHTASTLFEHGPFVRDAPGVNYPEGFVADLADPGNLLWFWPTWVLAGRGAVGAVVAWNLLFA